MFGASAPLLGQATTNTASTAHYHFGTVHFPVSCSPAAQAQFDIAGEHAAFVLLSGDD